MSNAHLTDNNNNKPEVLEHLDSVQRMPMVSYIVLVITTSHKEDFMKKYDRVETDVIHGDFKFTLAYAAILKAHRHQYSDAVIKFRVTAYDSKNFRIYSIARFKDYLACMTHETKEFLVKHGNNSEDGVHCGWDTANGVDAWLHHVDAVKHEQAVFDRDGDIALWNHKNKENIEYADASELYKPEETNG